VAQHDFDEDYPYVVIEKRSGDFSSFIVGLALGAGLALLMAPKSGAETRRELKERARRMRDVAEDLAQEATNKATDTFEQAKTQVEERIDAARSAVEMRKEQVSHAIDAGRVAARQAREELERRIAETKASYQAEGSARSGSKIQS
jgi:gas vesicle protein